MRNLEQTLAALYRSEINVTITTLWDGGYNLSLCSYMEWPQRGDTWEDWKEVKSPDLIGDKLHEMALVKYPTSRYARESQ